MDREDKSKIPSHEAKIKIKFIAACPNQANKENTSLNLALNQTHSLATSVDIIHIYRLPTQGTPNRQASGPR